MKIICVDEVAIRFLTSLGHSFQSGDTRRDTTYEALRMISNHNGQGHSLESGDLSELIPYLPEEPSLSYTGFMHMQVCFTHRLTDQNSPQMGVVVVHGRVLVNQTLIFFLDF